MTVQMALSAFLTSMTSASAPVAGSTFGKYRAYLKKVGECKVRLKCAFSGPFPGTDTPWMSSLPCCINWKFELSPLTHGLTKYEWPWRWKMGGSAVSDCWGRVVGVGVEGLYRQVLFLFSSVSQTFPSAFTYAVYSLLLSFFLQALKNWEHWNLRPVSEGFLTVSCYSDWRTAWVRQRLVCHGLWDWSVARKLGMLVWGVAAQVACCYWKVCYNGWVPNRLKFMEHYQEIAKCDMAWEVLPSARKTGSFS